MALSDTTEQTITVTGGGASFDVGALSAADISELRYHSGGVAGLRPDEVPTILQRGEEVITRNDVCTVKARFEGRFGTIAGIVESFAS